MKGVCACEKEMNCNFAYLSLILHLLRCSIAECFDLGLVGMAAFSPLFPSTFAESSTTTERKQKKYQIYSQSKLCDSLEVPFVMLNKAHFIHQKAKKKKSHLVWTNASDKKTYQKPNDGQTASNCGTNKSQLIWPPLPFPVWNFRNCIVMFRYVYSYILLIAPTKVASHVIISLNLQTYCLITF